MKNKTEKNCMVAEMATLPKCDFCDDVAAYDAKVKNHSSWAYFCEEHFVIHSHQKLGLGLGQKLVLVEVPKLANSVYDNEAEAAAEAILGEL